MRSFSFSKIIPGGNPTILLHQPEIGQAELAALSARLMSPLHLGAEQVGSLDLPEANQEFPHLRMMGGEFCVNATRAAAFHLALVGQLWPLDSSRPPHRQEMDSEVVHGLIHVSGTSEPVAILVSEDGEALERMAPHVADGVAADSRSFSASPRPAVTSRRLHCAACMDTTTARIVPNAGSGLPGGATLVHLAGISHLLLDADRHPLPDLTGPEWRRAAAKWRGRSGLADSPASGVVWFQPNASGMGIWPAVEVKATASEHLETACGSASMALALHLWQGREEPLPVSVIQPSGETLRVLPGSDGTAWISGPVFLAAQGRVYL